MIHAIDGVHDIVVFSLKHFMSRFLSKKRVDGVDGALRIYKSASFCHCFDLRFPDLAIEGVNLPIDITFAYIIEIDQSKDSDSGSDESFRYP